MIGEGDARKAEQHVLWWNAIGDEKIKRKCEISIKKVCSKTVQRKKDNDETKTQCSIRQPR